MKGNTDFTKLSFKHIVVPRKTQLKGATALHHISLHFDIALLERDDNRTIEVKVATIDQKSTDFIPLRPSLKQVVPENVPNKILSSFVYKYFLKQCFVRFRKEKESLIPFKANI